MQQLSHLKSEIQSNPSEPARHQSELALLHTTIRAMANTTELNSALTEMLVEVTHLLGAEDAALFLYNPTNSKLVFSAVVTPSARRLIGTNLPRNVGIANLALRERQSVWVSAAQDHPYFYDGVDLLTGRTTHSILAVPMLFQEKPVGVIEVINKLDGAFSQYDAEFVETLAYAAAIAISNTQLYTETERKARHLTILHELDQAMSISLRLPDIYHAFAQHAARLLPYDHLSIVLLDAGISRLVYETGDTESRLPVGRTLPRRNSVASWVTTHGQPLLRHNIITTPRFAEDEDLAAMGIQSTLAIPLRAKGHITGVWNMGSYQKSAYHPDDLSVAQTMADQLAISIENARLFEQVGTSRQQMRRLAQQIVSAQEKERQRLSQELHDEAGQSLTALKIGLELVQSDLPTNEKSLFKRLGDAVALTDITMEKLRLLARDLRPPALDTAGLSPTLEGLCRDFARRTHLSITYAAHDIPSTPFTDMINICLYRFLQETLTNAAKHAQANNIKVALRYHKKAISLTVQDDGQGFEKPVEPMELDRQKGIGLLGLQERLELLSGWLEIKSQLGHGAQLIAYIPFKGEH